jgi:hypothetical protein
MRIRLLGAVAIMGAAALLSAPARAVSYYSAIIDSAQVPSSANGGRGSQSPGTGWVNVVLADDESSLAYTMCVDNILRPPGDPQAGTPDTVVASHFHTGAPGVEGPVTKTIFAGVTHDITSPTYFTGTWAAGDATQPLTATNVANLKAGDLYVNLHSRVYPGGVIRGNLVPGAIPEPGSMALLASGLIPLASFTLRRKR